MAARVRPRAGEPRTRLKQVSIFTPTRIAILDTVRAHPGCTMTEVARAIGRDESTVSTNARLLRQARLLIVERMGKRSALFIAGASTPEQRLSAQLGASARLLAELDGQVPMSVPYLARTLGESRHFVRYHLTRLTRLGLVRPRAIRVLVTRTAYAAVAD